MTRRVRSGLAFAGALLVSMSAQAQSLPASTIREAVRGLRGQVTCVNGVAVILHAAPDSVLAALDRPEDRAETEVHEHVHILQLSGDCDGIVAQWEREPLRKLEAEAQAFCVGVLVVADTGQRRARVTSYRLTLSRLYGNLVGFADIWSALERWCG